MIKNLKHLKPERRFFQWALLGLGAWVWNGALAATVDVAIGDDFFNPTTVTISSGDTVTWIWGGAIDHSSTSDTGVWGSAIMVSGSFSHSFASAGSFPYHCTVHPTIMLGTVTVKAANVPPSVAITNPPSGAVLRAPASFTLGASASDTDGTVTNVQFFQGAVSLGNDTTRPYSVNVSNLASGNYTFSAVASDNDGAKATNSLSIIVDAPPSVVITNPPSGTTLAAPATLTLGASASDTDGTVTNVQFFQGAASLSNRITSPYSVTASNLQAGNYRFSAVATDNRGLPSTSAPVAVTVVTPVPVALSAPRRVSATSFQVSYSADVGLRYVVQRSGNLATWAGIGTNVAASNPVVFVDTAATGSSGNYRVGRLPNP